jgi:hypothetical protein
MGGNSAISGGHNARPGFIGIFVGDPRNTPVLDTRPDGVNTWGDRINIFADSRTPYEYFVAPNIVAVHSIA